MDEDDHDRELSPEEMADPACVECGGQGGWIECVGGVEETAWIWCDCIDEEGDW